MTNVKFLLSLCIISYVFHMCPVPTYSSSIDNVHSHNNYEEPISRSYFDEFARLSKYTLRIKDSTNDVNSFHPDSYSYEKWQEVLQGLSIFNDGRVISSDKTFDTLSLPSFIEELQLGSNDNASSCIKDIGRLVTSILSRESWAYQFLDAAGKPGPSISKGWVNFVGNYDQCTAAKASRAGGMNQFSGGYFTLPVSIVGVPIPIKFGFCLPNTCSTNQVTILFKELVLAANISNVFVADATEQKVVTNVTAATIAASIILALSVSLTIVGTFYDVFYVQKIIDIIPHNHVEVNGTSSHPNGGFVSISENSNTSNEAQPLIPKATIVDPSPKVCGKLLLAFSLYSNGKKLLNTSQSAGSLGSIHGIRFISMTWVVLGHCYLFGSMNYTLNYSTELPVLLHRRAFDAVMNAFVSVDTFFALSGLLTSYLTLQALWRHGLKINWLKVYFHRFWRLTPPYMIVLVIFLGFQQYLGHGPFWDTEQPKDKKFCEDNWWTNLLYINNLVKPKEMCFGNSWYLANDMQFFILSPLLLIPFFFHWMTGVAVCICFLLASWIATGVSSYYYDWGVTFLQVMLTPNSNWINAYYIVPWCRIGPYVMGILAGYALALTKGRPFRMKGWVVVVGWLVATASALAVLYGLHGDISGEDPSSRLVKAFYNTVGRSVWGACVCWVIVACAAGYGGPINALLSWSPFVVLGRLTYMTYLIHFNIVYIFFSNMGSLFFSNEIIMPVMFMGLLLFCNMVAFVAVLLFESPMIGLEKVLLGKQRQD